jgi:hypothetical protein
MELLCPLKQRAFGFRILGVGYAAVDRAHGGAGFVVEEPHTLRAFLRHDVKNLSGDGRMGDAIQLPFHPALVDGGIRAFRLARATVDAFTGNDGCHWLTSRPVPMPQPPYQRGKRTAIEA